MRLTVDTDGQSGASDDEVYSAALHSETFISAAQKVEPDIYLCMGTCNLSETIL